MKMAHYAYKHACYDIDYEKFQQLVKQGIEPPRMSRGGRQ